MFAAQALTDFDGQCFATEDVNHGQRSKAGVVSELIGYKVQTPDIVRGVNYRARLSSSAMIDHAGQSTSCAQPARDGVAVLALLDAATQRGTASMLFAEVA
jgi:hypothetical protein